MMSDREDGLSEGWPWPMMTKAVESIIENMQIEARLLQNEQAIADIEAVIDPELPATLNRIEGALDGQDIRLADLEAIDIVTNDALLTYLLSYIRRDELGLTPLTLPHREKSNTKPLSEHLVSYDIDGNQYATNLVVNQIIQNYLDQKLNKSDFDNFLMGKMTQETMDQIAFSLADVNVNGVSMNLGTALEDRPSFDQVPGIEFNSPLREGRNLPPLSLADWIIKVQDNEQFKVERDTLIALPSAWYPDLGTMPFHSNIPTENSWIRMIAENDKRLDELQIPELPEIGGMKTCFTDGGNALEGLIKSMETKIEEIEVKFDSMKDNMQGLNNKFIDLRSKISSWLDGVKYPISFPTWSQGLMDLLGEFVNDFGLMSGDFNQTSRDFNDSRIAFSDIRAKVTTLKNCGISNMNWNPDQGRI